MKPLSRPAAHELDVLRHVRWDGEEPIDVVVVVLRRGQWNLACKARQGEVEARIARKWDEVSVEIPSFDVARQVLPKHIVGDSVIAAEALAVDGVKSLKQPA